MLVPITFYYDDKGNTRATTSNNDDFGLFCEFLEADLQTPWSCATVLSNIQEFEDSKNEKWSSFGNLMLLEFEGQRAKVYMAIPWGMGDYGEPNEISIAELKELIRSWQAHLLRN